MLAGVAVLIVSAPACKSHSKKKKAEDTAKPVVNTGPQNGGHLRVPSNEPVYLNPVIQNQLDQANPLIFEGLVGLDARLEPVARLATEWDVAADGKKLTFKLRPGVKWHDGKPFTAKDVKFTFEAIRKTKVRSLWKAYMAAVASIETPDDMTVVVNYSEAFAPALKTWTVGIIPEHVYNQGEHCNADKANNPDACIDKLTESPANQEPVGTGPYTLQRWEQGKRLILQANEGWWNKRPYIESIEMRVDIPEDKVVSALKKGDIDFAQVVDITQWQEQLQSSEVRQEFEVSDVIEAHFRVLAWNVERPVLADKAVRQALTHALNRDGVINDILLGQARPLSGPFFPNMFGADSTIAPWPFDLRKASEMLDAAGYKAKDGARFSLQVIALQGQSNPITHATLGLFRRDLRSIGVDLQLQHLSPQEFFNRTQTRDFDAAYFGWLPEIADPDPYGLLHSSMAQNGSNYASYKNPDVDKLLDEGRSSTDRKARTKLYNQVHRIVHEDMPYTVLYAPYGHYAWSRRLRAVNPADIGVQPRFPGLAKWWIASDVRKSSTPGVPGT